MVRPGHHDGAPGAPPWCARGTTLVRPGHHHGAPGAPPWCARGTTMVRQVHHHGAPGHHHGAPGHHHGAPRAPSWCTDGTIVLHQLRGVHHSPLKSLLSICHSVYSRDCYVPGAYQFFFSKPINHLGAPRAPPWCARGTTMVRPGHHDGAPGAPRWCARGTILVHRWHHRAAPTEGGSPLPPPP